LNWSFPSFFFIYLCIRKKSNTQKRIIIIVISQPISKSPLQNPKLSTPSSQLQHKEKRKKIFKNKCKKEVTITTATAVGGGGGGGEEEEESSTSLHTWQ
jgi:hypothetical protein